ncbi:MAG: hypothetical protein QXR05_11480, partial [Candidatus Methanomethylicia archaeon]
ATSPSTTPISSPTSPTPSPTTITLPSTPTTPISSPTSPTPSPIQPIVNFKVGAYAEYIMKGIEDDELTVMGTYKLSVDSEENYKGNLCWLLSMTITQREEETKMITTWWITKTEYNFVHGRMQVYVGNNLVMQQEFDPGEMPSGVEEPEPIDVRYTTGYETITVPAGTFINCLRVEVSGEGGVVVKTWAHSSVPIWGVVKTEMYEDNVLTMTTELTSYG